MRDGIWRMQKEKGVRIGRRFQHCTLLYFGNDIVCLGRTKVCTWHHQRQRPWARTDLTCHSFEALKRQRTGARFRPRMPLITGVVFLWHYEQER